MSNAMRPRPRLEGQKNPALKPQKSPYGDGARVVPEKLGMRSAAARRLLEGKKSPDFKEESIGEPETEEDNE